MEGLVKTYENYLDSMGFKKISESKFKRVDDINGFVDYIVFNGSNVEYGCDSESGYDIIGTSDVLYFKYFVDIWKGHILR